MPCSSTSAGAVGPPASITERGPRRTLVIAASPPAPIYAMMPRMTFKVGCQLQPQATSVAALRDAWRRADAMGADSIWIWDHFFPLFGDMEATHFEGWTLLSAIAAHPQDAGPGTMAPAPPSRHPGRLAARALRLDPPSARRLPRHGGAGCAARPAQGYLLTGQLSSVAARALGLAVTAT